MKLNKYPEQLRPRERALRDGVETLSDIELLCIIFRTGSKDNDVVSLAISFLEQIGCLANLNTINYEELCAFPGIGPVKAIEVLAIVQICHRMNKISISNYNYASNPDVIFELYHKKFDDVFQEHFMVLSLNAKNAIVDEHTVFIGTLSQSLVHPRDIFKRIISKSASSFIVIHNHPSGEPSPSTNDIEITEQLAQLASLFAIPLLDHIIIGKGCYFSFKENNYL